VNICKFSLSPANQLPLVSRVSDWLIAKANRRRTGSAIVLNAAAIAVCVASVVLAPGYVRAQNIINTIVGGGSPFGAALSLDLPGPTSAVRDAAGNTYIAAPFTNYVFAVSGGNVTAFAGTGIEGYNGDGIQATSAQLALPNGLTIDSKGNIYIADYGTSRIRMVTPSGKISTVAGNGTKCEPTTDPCGDGGPASQANFNFPMDVAVDSGGNIFIADAFDNRIRRVDASTKVITTFAGNGNPCSSPTSSCGDGSSPIGATLNYPTSVAFDSAGNLYIADSRDNRIRMIPPGGATITTVVGTGAACLTAPSCGDGGQAAAATLRVPMWVFVDASNNLYIADTYDNEIRFVNNQTKVISTVAGNGQQGFSGDGNSATSAQLNSPVSVFLDNSGNLIIADNGNQRVRQVSGGNISTIAGGGNGNDGGPATNAILANPYNVAEDGNGNLYIADTANNRVRFVNMQAVPPTISTVAGTGNANYTGDNGPAVSAALTGPTGVAVDSSGNLWIADTGNLVIRRVDANTHKITTYAGTGRACNPTAPCGDGGPATGATFSTPLSIALDNAGNLYIADYTAHRIREVAAGTQMISTIAGTGVVGKKGNGGPAKQAYLNHPSSVALDSAGNIYIDDSYNNEIRRISGGTITQYALNTGFKLTGDGGPALNASMWAPNQISVDPGGNLFIGGGNDNVVQRVDAATYTIGTVAGDYVHKGVGGFSGDGGPATAARISNFGLVVDGQNNLYIADAGNNRIRSVHLTPAISINNPPGNFGAWPINSPSTPKTFTITSAGGVDLNLTDLIFGGNNPDDFSQTNTCGSLPALLGVDVTCSITVTFTPLNYGQRSATLILSDNGPNSPQTIFLNGYGPYFKLSASPTTINVSPGGSGNSTLTITPLGQFNQTVNLTCNGGSPAPPHTTCTINPTSVTLDGVDNGSATVTVKTSSQTPPGTYFVVATGRYGPQNQLQWQAKIQVVVQ